MSDIHEARNLVFARVGGLSLHRNWLLEPKASRNWDLQLSTYDEQLQGLDDGDLSLSIDTGTKWDSVCRYLRTNPDLLDRYDYIMFPDDDLLFEPNGLSNLFKIMASHDLDIGQPSLLPSSHISYPVTAHCPGFVLRYTNYVEPMCPIIRTDYLRTLLPILARWPTGWGQDDIWTMMMAKPAYRAAFIDASPILHTRPLYTGAVYKTFERLGMDPEGDLKEVRSTFRGLPLPKLIYGGISDKGRKIGHIGANIRNGLHLLRAASAMRKPHEARRVGYGMLSRTVTQFGYRPVQLEKMVGPSPAVTILSTTTTTR
ncbi:DUF707 domain-containing protein [Rhizobium wenxiniae]|uniref:DUF707 domain-containing protein n=1 Tax=Rhizobium wenxiniae TaxID=1737357 RepID=UPI001C6E5C14|nr:DUF707 domain-containing protein [Rhizobium wenxiniae]MBW9091017.1 DUF707 domain-containing protein [Rhizobium wenxiniae]